MSSPESVASVLQALRAHENADNVAGMARFGMSSAGRLGVPVPLMRELATRIGTDQRLALALWQTEIAEARIVASMIADPQAISARQADRWARDFDSWDVCDQVCGNLFRRAPWAWHSVPAWAASEREYVRRAAFALLACLATHDKAAPDERFLQTFPLIRAAATDDRNYVRKAISWALRNIGKRNPSLNREAILLARSLRALDLRPARWIAADAIRELESAAVRDRLARSVKDRPARARSA